MSNVNSLAWHKSPFLSPPVDPDTRLVKKEALEKILQIAKKHQKFSDGMSVTVHAWWHGDVRWARNSITLAADRRDMKIQIYVSRGSEYSYASVWTNQVDEPSIAAAVKSAERVLYNRGKFVDKRGRYDELKWALPLLPLPDTKIWSDSTFDVVPEQRTAIASQLIEGAGAKAMLSAGYIRMRAHEQISLMDDLSDLADDSEWDRSEIVGAGAKRLARTDGYRRHTEAQCSLTVRHPKGLGSGWGGLSGFDWSVIDASRLANTALEKCLSSLNPVLIEPGRYTVILEPAAVAGLLTPLVREFHERVYVEHPRTGRAFTLGVDRALGLVRSKLGLKVVDERITIGHNPMDGNMGIVPRVGMTPVNWIENGILKNLSYGRGKPGLYAYGIPKLNENIPVLERMSYTMSGGQTTVEEMIAGTKRGLVVTRFSRVMVWNQQSILLTGFTRDGLWLVENGKISKAVKNMRWTDSPLFVLNQIQQLGTPVPVFQPAEDDLTPVIVPPIKSNDFAFTATSDAI